VLDSRHRLAYFTLFPPRETAGEGGGVRRSRRHSPGLQAEGLPQTLRDPFEILGSQDAQNA
jgi:hypothetical protein